MGRDHVRDRICQDDAGSPSSAIGRPGCNTGRVATVSPQELCVSGSPSQRSRRLAVLCPACLAFAGCPICFTLYAGLDVPTRLTVDGDISGPDGSDEPLAAESADDG